MKKQKGIGLIEVIISALILALVISGCLKVVIDAQRVQRDSNERTAALYKLSSVMEVHRHNPYLVDTYTPLLLAGTASVGSFSLVDATTEELTGRDRFEATIEWLNQYDGTTQGFGLAQSHVAGPRHLCISSDCPALGGPTTPPVTHEAEKPPIDENGEVIVEEDGGEFPVIDPVDTDDDGYTKCKNGNNGFGNGDASAPGNSGPNNNANNAGNPDREDCEKKNNGNGNNWKFPT